MNVLKYLNGRRILCVHTRSDGDDADEQSIDELPFWSFTEAVIIRMNPAVLEAGRFVFILHLENWLRRNGHQ